METETGREDRQRDRERQRQGEMESGGVINGVVISTLVSGQGFEFLKDWKGGHSTLLLLSLLQMNEKTGIEKQPSGSGSHHQPHTLNLPLTGPQSETVHWRSQGGPVQFFSPTGLVLGSHSFSSSEQRMSLVTTLRSPHLAVHYKEARVRSIMMRPFSGTGSHPSICSLLTSDHSDISHCGPQAGLRHVLRSSGRTASVASHRSLYTELSKPGDSIFQQRTMRN